MNTAEGCAAVVHAAEDCPVDAHETRLLFFAGDSAKAS